MTWRSPHPRSRMERILPVPMNRSTNLRLRASQKWFESTRESNSRSLRSRRFQNERFRSLGVCSIDHS